MPTGCVQRTVINVSWWREAGIASADRGGMLPREPSLGEAPAGPTGHVTGQQEGRTYKHGTFHRASSYKGDSYLLRRKGEPISRVNKAATLIGEYPHQQPACHKCQVLKCLWDTILLKKTLGDFFKEREKNHVFSMYTKKYLTLVKNNLVRGWCDKMCMELYI